MGYNPTNPVTLNEAPKKSEYDRVFDNTVWNYDMFNVEHMDVSGYHKVLTQNIVTVSGPATYTMGEEHGALVSVSGSGTVTVTLPDIGPGVPDGRTYSIQKSAGSTGSGSKVVIVTAAADLISGMADITLRVPGHMVTLVAIDSNWWIVAEYWPAVGLRRPNTSVQTYTTAVNAAQIFPSSTYDDHGGLTYAAGVFTCVIPGLWDMRAHIEWVSNATGYRRAYLTHSVAGVLDLDIRGAVNGEDTSNDVQAVYKLLPGETVAVWALQNSGGNLNVKAGAFFQANLIRPTFV